MAHLTAAASTPFLAWLRSMAGARFRPAVHNQRRLKEHLGATDGPFTTGAGPLVTGPTLALVLAMAGRASAYEELEGPGVTKLRVSPR